MGTYDYAVGTYLAGIREENKKRGGGGRRWSFDDDWNPPKKDDILPYETVRPYRGNYVLCPTCGMWNSLNFGQDSFTCWLCKTEQTDDGTFIHMPVLPNVRRFIRGGGKKRNGAFVPCICLDESVRIDGEIRKCVLHHYAHEHEEQARTKLAAIYGEDWSGWPREVWKDVFSRFPRAHIAHNLIRMTNFHQVQDGDRTKYVPCIGSYRDKHGRNMPCQLCQAGSPVSFGRRAFWNPSAPVGDGTKGYLAALQMYESKQLDPKCASCGGDIEVIGYQCAACGKQVVDCFDEERFPDSVLAEVEANPQVCPFCSHKAKYAEILQCVRHTPGEDLPGCDAPRRTTIFDVNLTVSIEGDENQTSLFIHGHQRAEVPEAIQEMMKPFDFKFLLSMDLDKQAALMNMPNPFKAQAQAAASAAAREYGGGGQG